MFMAILAEIDWLVEKDLSTYSSDELAALVPLVHKGNRAMASISAQIARQAARTSAKGDGPPPEDLLLGQGDVSASQAKRDARRGRTSEEFPKVGDAVDKGEARPENVDAIGAAASHMKTPEHKAGFAACEGDMADKAAKLPPETFRRWLKRVENKITEDAGLGRFERQRAASHFGFRENSAEMTRLWGLLDPEWSAILTKEVRAESRRIAKARGCSVNDHIQAEALINLVQGSGGRSTPGVLVLQDERTMRYGPHDATVSESSAGESIPPETVARLACDAAIQGIEINGQGIPLRVGRKHRSATDAQRKALRAIYRTCAIDGSTPFDRCEVHHVDAWITSRNTDIENLLPISMYWHHMVHEGGWQLKINPDRSIELRTPKGKIYRRIPPPDPL
jgi:hypothetical protein